MPVHVCHQVDVGLTPFFFKKTYIPERMRRIEKGLGWWKGSVHLYTNVGGLEQ